MPVWERNTIFSEVNQAAFALKRRDLGGFCPVWVRG